MDSDASLDDQPVGKHFKPSKKAEEATPVPVDVPVSSESTADRLARERSYMSDFPHTTPRADATADERKSGDATRDSKTSKQEKPKKKSWLKRLFG